MLQADKQNPLRCWYIGQVLTIPCFGRVAWHICATGCSALAIAIAFKLVAMSVTDPILIYLALKNQTLIDIIRWKKIATRNIWQAVTNLSQR